MNSCPALIRRVTSVPPRHPHLLQIATLSPRRPGSVCVSASPYWYWNWRPVSSDATDPRRPRKSERPLKYCRKRAVSHLHGWLPLKASGRGSHLLKILAGTFASMNRTCGPLEMSAARNIPSNIPWPPGIGVVVDTTPLSKYTHRAAMARPRPFFLRPKRSNKFQFLPLSASGALQLRQRQFLAVPYQHCEHWRIGSTRGLDPM